ncbi:hypothetical protein LINGRAHAP2_LOCUS8288 [Linum grandiflorum]
MLPYCRLARCFRTTFRAAELSAALHLSLWILIRLPVAFQIAADFFRRLSVVIQSPLFVFLFFNAIIFAILIMTSGRGRYTDQYHCGNSLLSEEEEVVVFQEEQIITPQQVDSISDGSQLVEDDAESTNDVVSYDSESADSGSEGGGGEEDDDELSNEEFQRAVEEFIAENNLRFRREETFTFQS